jgi:hypothetical protein
MKRLSKSGVWLGLLALMVIPLQAAAEEQGRPFGQAKVMTMLSQQVALRYALSHPNATDGPLRQAGERMAAIASRAASTTDSRASTNSPLGSQLSDRFNLDDVGLPQNEEAVAVCPSRPRYVLSGTNDYRGLLDPRGNFTGWHFSTDGGRSVTKEGLLPAIWTGGQLTPSGGDPVIQTDAQCNYYFVDLNYPADNPFANRNGIGLYKTTLNTLLTCPGGEDPDQLTQPSCWPQRKLVAFADIPPETGVGSFLDKPWFDVGPDGHGGQVIWIAFSDFKLDPNTPLGFTGAQIKAVRCKADLSGCTQPILISGTDEDIQFADVTVANNGSALITWAQIEGELEQERQAFTVKARIAAPGSTVFGPTRIVNREVNPLPFGGFMHANDFRIATYPKSIMPLVDGKPRIFIIWDRCRYLLLDNVCEESQIYMATSRDLGGSWSPARTLSLRGDNYFPAVSDEYGSGAFAVAWFTNRLDWAFHNRQSVEVVTLDVRTNEIIKRSIVTRSQNESEADPILGGFFIGDYIDVDAASGVARVAYNGNYRPVRVLGEGFPIPQQDNYLTRTAMR